MDNFKRTMTFSRSERIAIITIVSMIVIILIIKYLIIKNPPKRDYFKHDLDSIVARREFVMDSVRVADSIEKANKQTVISSEAKRNREITAKKSRTTQLAEIYSLPAVGRNDDTLHASFRAERSEVEKSQMIDINTADTTLLKQLPGIGSTFAKRIVEYRERLGGYCESEQLLEVYMMDTARYEGIKDFVKIDSLFAPNKLRINSDVFKTLVKHPYLEFDDVKKIVNHREQKGMIASWEQLQKILSNGINPKLRYYIDYQ